MFNRKNIILKVFILSIMFIGLNVVTSKATIHSTDPKGETNSTVSITITSTEALENFDLTIGSSGGLTYSSVSTSGIPNTSNGAVSYAGLTGLTTLATYTFKTPSTPGTYKVSFNVNGVSNSSVVTVTAPATSNETPSNNEGQGSSNSDSSPSQGTTTETPQPTTPAPTQETPQEQKKSNNANLKNLGITPNDFKGFKPQVTSYDVTVPKDVEKISVYAETQDSKAKITSGTGYQKLNVGENSFKVVVTAEDGTTKTYTLNVTRKEEAEEKKEENQNSTKEENVTDKNEVTETKTKSDLTSLQVAGYTLTPKFSPDIYEYKLDVNRDVSSIDITAKGANSKVSVEVVGNTDLVDGENVVTILVYNEETKENLTYQILVNKKDIDMDALNTSLDGATKKGTMTIYIVIGVIAFVVVGIGAFIIVRRRYNGYMEDDDKYEYDDEDEDKISDEGYHEKLDLDDEEELFHRVNSEFFKKTKEDDDFSTIKDDEDEENTKNSILSTDKDDFNKKVFSKVEANDKEDNSEEEFFRTSRNGKSKGKHF